MEIWKNIKLEGFENYSVSNLGNIRHNKINKLRKPSISGGYARINLINGSLRKSFLVHRLVAIHFIPNPDNKPTVNHIDRDRLNNKVYNLEWASHKDQMLHCIPIRVKRTNVFRKGVWRIDLDGNKVVHHKSIRNAANWAIENVRKVKPQTAIDLIGGVCRYLESPNKYMKKHESAFGYRWSFGDDVKSLDGEIWAKIPTGRVSNYGRVVSNHTLARARKLDNGYWSVFVNGKMHYLHVLVAKMFIDNPDSKPQVNHIDSNKDNYKLSNLEWVTCKENAVHRSNYQRL